jgi:hypothetical protein
MVERKPTQAFSVVCGGSRFISDMKTKNKLDSGERDDGVGSFDLVDLVIYSLPTVPSFVPYFVP